MAHSLILGMTESGKTTFARHLAAEYLHHGFGVLVLDPLNDPRWPASFKTARVDEFLRVYWQSRKCMAFIDEAGKNVGRFDDVMIETATEGRHWGHSNHFITQRGALLSVTVRDQCSHLFLFTTSKKDCEKHADEWNKPELVEASQFPAGTYFHATRFGVLERDKIF